ncbi:MAG: hypothetical protein U0360_03440 [Dehalococcoidia bacterium]
MRNWLEREVGVAEWRRLARLDEDSALVSKFQEGFAPQLHALLEALPELVDESAVLEAYGEAASTAAPGTLRTEAWARAMHSLLARACVRLGIPETADQQSFVRVGVDSVRALLESVLWTSPAVDEAYVPAPGERAAYLDITRAFAGRDFFTRNYGIFEDHIVQNHCPGAAYGRVFLAQAWRACTGTPAPLEAATR